MKQTTDPLLPDRILTREEAAQFIGRAPATVDRYVACGVLKRHFIGLRPVFLLSELTDTMKGPNNGTDH